MSGVRSIATIQKYGRIKLHLKKIMDEKNVTRNQLARLTDTRFEVVNKWYNGTVERIDSDILARFCYALGCTVSDILEYVND